MLPTNVKLFLPITGATVARMIDSKRVLADEIRTLGVDEISGLLVLQYLPKFPEGEVVELAERALAQSIELCTEYARNNGHDDLVSGMTSRLDPRQIADGLSRLEGLGVYFLNEPAVAAKDFLDAAGRWDFSFTERQKSRLIQESGYVTVDGKRPALLTEEQGRIFRIIQGELDEHLHVQGYAGTGKSYVIRAVLSTLVAAGARVLVLAERWPQLKSLTTGIEDRAMDAKTFGQLASTIIPQNLTERANLRMRRASRTSAQVGDDKYIDHFSIRRSGRFSEREIVQAAHATVRSFCTSGDQDIHIDHLPDRYKSTFDDVTASLAIHLAREFWIAVRDPPPAFDPPIRVYHQIKYAALNKWRIPEHYTHVLIDECHNLSKAMTQILDSSIQAVISLGDEYQRMRGRMQPRSHTIRQRIITQSVRSGTEVEMIINPIIGIHPSKTKDPFKGNRWNRMSIAYYDKPHVPDEPATILVTDNWALFEWAQRLAAERVDYTLLSSRDDLSMFVQDCIELYRNGVRGRHPELFRFGSWQELARRYHGDSGFQRIESLLSKEYSIGDWQKTLAKAMRQVPTKYSLGRVEDVRNQEFDAVMITPEAADVASRDDARTLAEVCSMMYVAVTRARRRLIAPIGLRHRIEQISSRRPTVADPISLCR